MLDKSIIKKALAPLEAGFESDGMTVQVGEIEENRVVVKILLTPTACRECLMPIPHLEKLFEQSLLDEGIKEIQVRVVVVDEPPATAS